jgi:transposase
MKTTINYNNKSKEELLKILSEKDSHIQCQAKQIQLLEEMNLAYRSRQFANKSEKLSHIQNSLFDEAQLPKEPEKIFAAEEEIKVAPYTRKKTVGRKPLPEELTRIPHIYDLHENEKTCHCGCVLTHIKDEKSEQLEIIPAKIYVIEHIRKKYACKGCEETIKTAKLPLLPIPRSIASSGLLSHVLVSKFVDHLPLFRQEQILKRIGVDIPRATLSLWVIKCAELLLPLMKLLHDIILNYDIAYADETTTQVLKEPNKGIQSKKYMWVFAGGPPEQFVFYYHYHHSRSHETPLNFFAEFKGYLHCDGFSGYDSLASANPDIIQVGCLYHARRKFAEVIKITKAKEGIAITAINFIAKVANIEEDIKLLSPDTKHSQRLEKVKPILDELYAYLMQHQPQVPPKSLLGKAVSYTLNQWPKLLIYLQDGRLENNNNRSERAIKPFVIGRKAWLFSNSIEGAQAGATIFSLVETCKHHSVEPYDYFRYVLNILPSCQTMVDYEALLPFNIDKRLLIKTEN